MEKKTLYSDLIITDILTSKTLFLKRSDIVDYCPREWGLPGGHMEKGEEPGEAALREAFEETGLDFIGKLVPIQKKMFQDKKAICFYHQVVIIDPNKYGVLRLDMNEHQSYGWYTIYDAIMKLDLMANLNDRLQEMFFNVR